MANNTEVDGQEVLEFQDQYSSNVKRNEKVTPLESDDSNPSVYLEGEILPTLTGIQRKSEVRKKETLNQSATSNYEGGEPMPNRAVERTDNKMLDNTEITGSKKDVILDEHGLPKLPTGDAQKDKEIKDLQTLIKQERSHGQWSKQGLNLASLIMLLLQSLFRGGLVKKCSAGDWIFTAVFVIVMIVVVYIAVKIVSKQ
jgi:hypothetical protein